ncbi:MAG: hypothetical protein ABL857_01885 [Rickettsiales bacterium]
MEKIQKYLPTPLILLTFLVSFIAIYATGSPILQDNDMGWHIMAGDLIRNTGEIPLHDSWSFSGSEQIWYNISWLWDIILSFVHEKVGVQGLFIFTVACPALLVALLLASIQKRVELGINALIFIGMISTYCMLEFATGRPQIIGMFFALFFHHILHSSRKNINDWMLFLLPLIMILWVNIHGSFFAGFIIIGAYGLEAIYSKNRAWVLKLLLIGVLCIVAALVNPYGIHIITAVTRTLNTVVAKYVVEWQPFVFGKVMGASLWLLVFIGFSDLRAKNIPIADKILAVIWVIAVLSSVRNIAMLVVLGAPYIAANLPPDDEKDSNTRKLSVWINDLRFSPIIMAAIPLTMIVSYFLLPVLGAEHYLEKADKSPMPAINYVMQNYAGKRVLNDYDYGGRIIYETKGELPIFTDGRAGTVYSEKILTDFLSLVNMDDDWQKNIEPYKIDVIMLGNGHNFVKAYERGLYNDAWEKTFSDEVASVYVRK